MLETATELRYDLYDPMIEFPEPLVPRRRRIGITERCRYDGEMLTALSEADVAEAPSGFAAENVESVAVCFLHAYANSVNETAAALRALGSQGAFFVMSSSGGTLSLDLAREFPVRLVESGPAAGVSIAANIAERQGLPDLLSFDMGGTTAKISSSPGANPLEPLSSRSEG